MNVQPVAITRCALITPLDDESGGTWDALCAGRRVGKNTTVDNALLDGDADLDRSIRLALAVARRVLPGNSSNESHADSELMLFCGTSKGPAQTMLRACELLRAGSPLPEIIARQVALGAGAMGTILREKLRLAARDHTSVAACSSGLHALHAAAAAIHRGECRRALIVAADASLHPLFEASFARLGVLAASDAQGIRRCEPFAPSATGFFPVEAAAAILLEFPDSPGAHPPIAWLTQSWIGGDSTDLIALDPDSATLRAGLQLTAPNRPAFIHAHATGTAHDAYELAAIRAVFGNDVPIFSHKKFLGHSLGAAGLVSVVLSALCHAHRQLPTAIPVPPESHSITIAQGFGGHIGIVTLRGN